MSALLIRQTAAAGCGRPLLALLLGAALLAGCSSEREELCPCPPEQQHDEQLMLVLSSARALHHQADLYLEQGEVAEAIGALRRILELELEARWPAAEEVRLDATARLAKLLLGQGEEQQALDLVDQALASGARESFYLSNLHGVRGEILEHRADRLRQAGQEQQAKQVARQAIAAYEQSIAINKRLQRALLQGGER